GLSQCAHKRSDFVSQHLRLLGQQSYPLYQGTANDHSIAHRGDTGNTLFILDPKPYANGKMCMGADALYTCFDRVDVQPITSRDTLERYIVNKTTRRLADPLDTRVARAGCE